jgi:hypothetical protein
MTPRPRRPFPSHPPHTHAAPFTPAQENYSPFPAWSSLSPGNNGGWNKSNAECTGWEFYTWGALNGVPALLEAQAANV